MDRLELLEAAPRADRDARERALGEVDGHLRLVAQPLVEAVQERTAAGEHDAAIHDVGRELGRGLVERRLDRLDDLRDGLVERAADLLGGEDHRLRQAGEHVAAAHLGLELLLHVPGGADLELDLLGGLLADEELVVPLDVIDDRLVHLVAADAQRLRDDDAAEADHGDLGGAAADVDDHVPGRLGDGEPGADRGGHRLLDQVGLARAGGERRLLDGALLDPGDARRDADDDARVREAVLVDLLDEVAEHLLGDVEVGDDAVLERADRLDRARRAAEHPLRLDSDRVHLAGALVDRDDRGLGEHDAAPAHVDERVCGAEIDRHVAAAEPCHRGEDAHRRFRVYVQPRRFRKGLPLFRDASPVYLRRMNNVSLIGNLATDGRAPRAWRGQEGGELPARREPREPRGRRGLRRRAGLGPSGGALRGVPDEGAAGRRRGPAAQPLLGRGGQAADGRRGGGPTHRLPLRPAPTTAPDVESGAEVIPFEAAATG